MYGNEVSGNDGDGLCCVSGNVPCPLPLPRDMTTSTLGAWPHLGHLADAFVQSDLQ